MLDFYSFTVWVTLWVRIKRKLHGELIFDIAFLSIQFDKLVGYYLCTVRIYEKFYNFTEQV